MSNALRQRRCHRRRRAVSGASLLAALMIVAGCGSSHTVAGSGIPVSETRTIPTVHAVDVAGTLAVIVQVGKPQSVTVRADDNLISRITTRVHDGTLLIDDQGSFRAVAPMSVTVVLPSLDRVTLSGGGSVDVRALDTAHAVFQLSGTGLLRATGTAQMLDATLTGTGEEDLSQVSAKDATALLTGTGHVALRASASLTANVHGTGSITYSGNPSHLVTHITGTGSITPQ